MTLGRIYFLLTMANHGLVQVERQMHGVHVPRYLNSAGRWAGNGKRVPLLVWETRDAAQAAAEVASACRKKPVTVAQRADSSWQVGKAIRVFSELDAPALRGYTGHR
jgi:hypothetical protein